MGRKWMRSGRKSSWEGEQCIVAQEKGKSERDKKIVLIKLIQKTNTRYSNNKSSVCLVEVQELFLWCSILVLELDILSFVGKSAAPLVRQHGVKMAGGFFLFFFPTFFDLVLCMLQMGALMWSYLVTCL
jgi:hypothetical protein